MNELPKTALEPAWYPTPEVIEHANVTAVARQLGLSDFTALHRWSVENREAFWRLAIDRLQIRLLEPFERLLDATHPTRPRWLVGGRMNIVESCFQADDSAVAVIESDGSHTRRWSIAELRQLTARVANGLVAEGITPGDAVAVVMPMMAEAVAIYLGIIAAGATVVSVADSFAADEIAARFRLGKVKLVFTRDVVHWHAKRLQLYEKIAATGALRVVVCSDVPAALSLRGGDIAFETFLSGNDHLAAVPRDPSEAINILFSSGTTGEPKAIPWDHTTPIKCAVDAHFHQDLHPGDIACWPTSLGWMMGPWLIFATLLNRSAMALYAQAPTDAGFGQFVQDAGVTLLGLVPSLVRAWKQSDCLRERDWTQIRVFSSSGECSNPADMRYLMELAGGRPVIEYCGGTEIGGGYISGTVVQPCVPSTFSTPVLGLDFVLLNENYQPSDKGEAFIEGPSIGLSTRLVNRDNDAVYFEDAPIGSSGMPLRRHGDEMERLPGGYYRVVGRSDDTMNLGGIKVGCAEIERVLNQLPGVQETAAIAVSPAGGGPSQLVIYLVATGGDITPVGAFKSVLQQAIRSRLNPLFHIEAVRLVASLPRTASNKIMRRELRAQFRG